MGRVLGRAATCPLASALLRTQLHVRVPPMCMALVAGQRPNWLTQPPSSFAPSFSPTPGITTVQSCAEGYQCTALSRQQLAANFGSQLDVTVGDLGICAYAPQASQAAWWGDEAQLGWFGRTACLGCCNQRLDSCCRDSGSQPGGASCLLSMQYLVPAAGLNRRVSRLTLHPCRASCCRMPPSCPPPWPSSRWLSRWADGQASAAAAEHSCSWPAGPGARPAGRAAVAALCPERPASSCMSHRINHRLPAAGASFRHPPS